MRSAAKMRTSAKVRTAAAALVVAAVGSAGLALAHHGQAASGQAASGQEGRGEPVPTDLAEFEALMKEATCGGFALVGPDDPYSIPGFETPVRAARAPFPGPQ